jgi:hypothetical protein
MTRFWVIAFLGLAFQPIQSQELPTATQQQLEGVAAATEDEPDETLLLQLEALRRRPLNLNSATTADLQVFPFLTPLHIDQFLSYRAFLGLLHDVHELQAVPGWDVALVRQLLPFVMVAPIKLEARRILKNMQASGNNMLQLRWSRTLQKARGFKLPDGAGFGGDRNALLLRYLFRKPGVQYGFVADKDAGEALFKKDRASPDFFSAHLFLRGNGRLKALAIGDFTLNLGQGLIHWQSMAWGKSSEVLSIKRQGAALRPYASAGEAFYLRGTGATWGKGPLEATVFAAHQKINVNLDIDEWGEQIISSFSPGGLHRTRLEYGGRRAAGQLAAGGSIVYRKPLFHAAVNGVWHRFSLPIQKNDAPYNLFGLKGRQFFGLGADYGFSHRNIHLFGEAALDGKGHPAIVQGAIVSIHSAVDVSALGRFIHKSYAAISANAFTESSTTTAEQGLYLGLQWRLPGRIRLSAYADLFRYSWLRFRTDAPGTGKDYLLHLLYQPTKKTEAYLLLRSEAKPANRLAPATALRQVMQKQRYSVRVQWSREINKGWMVRSRAEAVRVLGADSVLNGCMFFVETHYRPSARLAMDVRLAWFDATGFDSRIYTYENDVLYGYSIPALYGRGIRAYGNVRIRLHKHVTAWLRVANSFFAGADTNGSGLMAIDGSNRTDFRIQLIFSF